jgi:hypothetical protein
MRDGEKNAAQVHAQRAGVEACVREVSRHEVSGDGLPVDGGDEHSVVMMEAHTLLAARAEKVRKASGNLRAFRLFSGQKDEQIGVAATEPRDQLAVAQDHFRISGASENARGGLRVFFRHWKIGPAQD